MKQFRPRTSAALLAFLCILCGGLFFASPARADTTVQGDIALVSIPTSSFTIKINSNQIILIRVGTYTWITKDRFDCSLANLRTGDKARVALTIKAGSFAALRVDAMTKGDIKQIKGTLSNASSEPSQILVDRNGKPNEPPTTVHYDKATLFVYNGVTSTSSDIKNYQGADVTVVALSQANDSLLASRVDVSIPRPRQVVTVFGLVTSKSDNELTVRTWQGNQDLRIKVTETSRLTRNKRASTLSGMNRGDRILGFATRDFQGELTADLMSALSPDVYLRGTITAILPSQKIVAITLPQGDTTINFQILSPTLIQINGQEATLEDLKVGDMVGTNCLIHLGGPWGAMTLDVTR